MIAPDPWTALRRHTLARIALGRTGASLPTAEWLRFAEAHALARDAVHTPLDVPALVAALHHHGIEPALVASAAPDRATYLRRPDLGRRLADASATALVPCPGGLTVVLADGLSARATQAHALPLVLALRAHLEAVGDAAGVALGAVVVATQARVALGDEIGERLGADAVLVLIGERPGLSSPDSLGAYLTWAPRRGRRDAERNCVSNIRPEGQSPAQAAARLAWLLGAARRLGATGVALKDESDVGAAVAAIERRDDAPTRLPGQSAA
ncbi:MAG: ethanolamine ammonia-lyase subunit EutC [Ideonella sp. WA131b]|jgi:ethanolamine ammonia-lyase small subunit|nr:ethanolamine ammonia-lyase subunit EutC [Ideonella sp. WA131b]